MNKQLEKCLSCCWVRLLGDRLFCPSAYGTCLKQETAFRYKKPEQDTGKDEGDAKQR